MGHVSIKAITLLAACVAALAAISLAHQLCRDSNVSRIAVSNIWDLHREFDIRDAKMRVRNPEVLRVCFAGDYVYALKDARRWFAAGDAEFDPVLQAAGGRADVFNGEGESSIVLLTRKSAVIMQLNRRTGLAVANFGCVGVDAGHIEMRTYQTSSVTEFVFPNATLKASIGSSQLAGSCVQRLRRFVETIDELLTDNVTSEQYFWAAIRKYLPSKGCSAEEVLSVVGTSKFFVLVSEQNADDGCTILFRNADTILYFALRRATGNIEYPGVGPRHPPLPSF